MAKTIESTTQYDNYKLRLVVSESNVSTANNTSNVDWTLYIVNGGRRFAIGNFSYTVTINGSQVANFTGSCSTTDVSAQGGVHFLNSGTLPVEHTADGSKSVVCSATCSGRANGNGPGNGSLSDTFDLTTIARKATLSSVPNFTDEDSPIVTYSNPAGSAVNELLLGIYNTAGNVAYAGYRAVNKTGTLSYQFNFTNEELQALRQACTGDSMTVRFYLRTSIGGSYLYDIADRTMTIVNGEPTFTDFAYEDVNATTLALTGDSSKLIIGYSRLKGTISDANKATANKEATMSSYTLKCGESNSNQASYSSTNPVEITLNSPTTSNSIKMYATDSRGNSKVVEKTATYVNYNPLTYTLMSVARENGTSERVKLTLEGTIDEVNFGVVTNSIVQAKYRYIKMDESASWSAYTDINVTVNNGQFSFDNYILGDTNNGFDINYSYAIQVRISDELVTLIPSRQLGSGKPNIALAKTGVAIMGKYDDGLGGALQVNGDLYINGKKPNTYSGTETVVGSWFDKPLYRLVAEYSAINLGTDTTTWDMQMNFSNISTMTLNTNHSFFVDTDTGLHLPIPYNNPSTATPVSLGYFIEINNGVPIFHLRKSSYIKVWTLILVLEYTKTTD